jgi:hypothetical protein
MKDIHSFKNATEGLECRIEEVERLAALIVDDMRLWLTSGKPVDWGYVGSAGRVMECMEEAAIHLGIIEEN